MKEPFYKCHSGAFYQGHQRHSMLPYLLFPFFLSWDRGTCWCILSVYLSVFIFNRISRCHYIVFEVFLAVGF